MITLPNSRTNLERAVKDAEKFLKKSRSTYKVLKLPKSTSNNVLY